MIETTLGLDEISAEIHRVWVYTKAHQVAAWDGYYRIGWLLSTARTRHPSNDRYGSWFEAQAFPFSFSWGTRLRQVARRKGEIEALFGTAVPDGVNEVLRKLRWQKVRDADAQARWINPPEGVEHHEIVPGRVSVWIADFASVVLTEVDLIVTDPPYPDEFAESWSTLGAWARATLRDQGLLVALCGLIQLHDRMVRISEHLAYGWVYMEPLKGPSSRILGRHITKTWKPWLAFTKGAWPVDRVDWHPDTVTSGTRAKTRYRWEQATESAQYLIERLTLRDGLVVDPFLGTGTYGVAAIQAGRRFVGIEADRDRAMGAVDRLRKATA